MRHLGWLAPIVVVVIAACDPPREEETEAEQPSSSSASTTYGITGPDGTHNWVVVKCGSTPECYQRAAITCPAGWSVYDKDKSTAYDIHGVAKSSTVAWDDGTSTTNGSSHSVALPVEHGEMLVKCGSSEQNDAKLVDQLKALCDDGNDKACKAHDFATKKRGCCAWHQGARSCNADGQVVCFDGTVNPTCSC